MKNNEFKEVYKLFKRKVNLTPNGIAITLGKQELTYKRLDNIANQLACYLKKELKKINNKGLTKNAIIGLCVERSLSMVIGVLGISKAGGICVQINPGHSKERLKSIIGSTCPSLILTNDNIK